MLNGDWNDLRKKTWHLLLLFGTAYVATNPEWAWAAPVLTGAAGISAPPASLSAGRVVGVGLLAASLGVSFRLVG